MSHELPSPLENGGRLLTDSIFQRNDIVPSIFLPFGKKIRMRSPSNNQKLRSFSADLINALLQKRKWDVLRLWMWLLMSPVFSFCCGSLTKPTLPGYKLHAGRYLYLPCSLLYLQGQQHAWHTGQIIIKMAVFSSVYIVFHSLLWSSKSDCVILCLDERCINWIRQSQWFLQDWITTTRKNPIIVFN